MNRTIVTERRVPIIGIVGGIGSGKSALAAAFTELGCTLIDADRVGHEMLVRNDVRRALVSQFGCNILDDDGRIDRPRLAAVAFADEQSTERLNEIVGAALWNEFRRRAQEAAARAGDAGSSGDDAPAVVLDAALLFESGMNELCDGVVFVEAPDHVRQERIQRTRGWDWEEVRRREARQFALSRKREMADEVVENTAGLDHLATEARRLLTLFRERRFSQ
ncbi:MAG: dephospho-CoA kinase [Planctomycetes bacterium]|nr:dephospho-CoA kinase [Planctomycetota bacterium]